MTDQEKLDAGWARYTQAAGAVQAGVNAKLALGDSAGATAKLLRAGVDNALVQNSALQNALVEKGIFTMLEIATINADAMETEVRRYEQELTTISGRPVSLKSGVATFEDPPKGPKN